MPEPAIQVKGLTKTFQRKQERGLWHRLRHGKDVETLTAVDHVDLEVAEGELFGLLGPNGAGKTTLIKLLATLLLPAEGTATVAGLDVEEDAAAVRKRIGVVLGGERALYWRLTARENLWYFSQLYDIPRDVAEPRIDALLDEVGLGDRADERVENYSKGMKQRLHIARGLLNEPEVLLLDEPTIGLDPHAARDLRDLVKDLKERGLTIILTTHYMHEADVLSDRVGIMSHGRLVAVDDPEVLKAQHAEAGAYTLAARCEAGSGLEQALQDAPGVASVVPEGHDAARGVRRYRVLAEADAEEELAGVLAEAVATAGGRLVSLQHEEPSLEDVFVRLTGERLSTAAEPAQSGPGDEEADAGA